MEGASVPPPDSNPSPAGASKYLSNLPSRGLFASTVPSSNPLDGMRVYICDHDTSPPEGQLIKTNQTNILIRSLMFKKQKADSSLKGVKGTAALEASRKRPAEEALDSRAAAMRTMTNTQVDSRQEASRCRIPEKDFQSLTVERLRVLLRGKGLSPRGKKDELIARLKGVSG